MTRTLDCDNLVALLASMNLDLEQEVTDIQCLQVEQQGKMIDRETALEYLFDALILKSYMKTGKVPQFCLHECIHANCRHNGLNYGEIRGT